MCCLGSERYWGIETAARRRNVDAGRRRRMEEEEEKNELSLSSSSLSMQPRARREGHES